MAKRDQGKAFLQGVFSKLPAEKQAQYGALLDDPDAGVILDEIGDGVLRQSDYSRQMNTLAEEEKRLTTWHGQLTEWHTTKASEFATKEQDLATREEALRGRPNPSAAEPPAKGAVTKEDLDQFSRNASYGVAMMQDLAFDHFTKFGERLDTVGLLQRPEVVQHGLEAGYKLIFKDKIDAHDKAAQEKRDNALREEGARKAREELGSRQHLPYPTPGPGEPGSPLDALTPAGATPGNEGVVDKAVQSFYELQAQR